MISVSPFFNTVTWKICIEEKELCAKNYTRPRISQSLKSANQHKNSKAKYKFLKVGKINIEVL